MPTADDLFRPTNDEGEAGSGKRLTAAPDPAPDPETGSSRRTSGRVRHDEKMTVYVTADELIELEHARLSLRREHGLAVDRGRLVREAIAIALSELNESGQESALIQRLTAS